jgi:hypothetical protein
MDAYSAPTSEIEARGRRIRYATVAFIFQKPRGAIRKSSNARADFLNIDRIGLEGFGERMIRKWVVVMPPR